jgi:integrase/recombinase XerD
MPESNLYRRGETWWLRATANGREFRESLRTRDVKTARRLRDKRLEEINAAAYRGEVRRTWEEAVTAWSENSIGQLSRLTLKRYAVSLTQCFPHLTGLDISQIDGKALRSLVQARRTMGATPATVRRDLTAISRVLEFAEANGWREGNPTLSTRRLLKERRDPITLPDSVTISSVIAAGSPRFGALIVAALLTGCRQDELVRLGWRQWNPTAHTLDIIGKGNKRRTIQLSEEAASHLTAQLPKRGELIFCHEDGTPFTQAASDFCHVRRIVEKKYPNFRRFRYHDLRHLFAVNALRNGMDLYTLSKHLGHSSVLTTEIYTTFLTPEEVEQTKRGSYDHRNIA